MGSRGQKSASSNSSISYTESQKSMQKKFETYMRKTGKSNFTLVWLNATPEQKSKIAAAKNIATENVFGKEGHATSDYLSLSEKQGKGYRYATISNKLGGRTRVFVSENPTEKELLGARASVYQMDKER